MGKRLKSILLYGIPIILTGFLPQNYIYGQARKPKYSNDMRNINGKMVEIPFPTTEPDEFEKSMVGKSNTLSLAFQPEDLGYGIRYDKRLGNDPRRIWSRLGAYSAISRGRYKFKEIYSIKNHFKIAIGGEYYLKENPFEDSRGFINLGASYHYHGERESIPGIINEKIFRPLSADFGGGLEIKDKRVTITFDFFRGEGTVHFGKSSKNINPFKNK